MVSKEELRRMFRELRCLELLALGELQSVLHREGHPSPPRPSPPICTRSQVLRYLDATGTTIAYVHQFLRPDGTLGGSGLPDPKRVLVDGVGYIVTGIPE